MQENHCHHEDEDCNPGHEYQKTEAYEQDRRDLDTMVLPKTAMPLKERNNVNNNDKHKPVTCMQALLSKLTLKLQDNYILDPQQQI